MTAEQDLEHASRLISRVLAPAVRLWLRSQVQSVAELQVQIEGGDRQILSGHIPKVTVAAQHAVYQGVHLSQICLSAQSIRINLGQLLRGKPLRLLAVVPVQGEVTLRQSDLTASLQHPELAAGLADLLLSILRSAIGGLPLDLEPGGPATLEAPELLITGDRLTFSAQLITSNGQPLPLAVRTGLQASGRHLQLVDPHWLPHPQAKRGFALKELHGFAVDLGPDIEMQELTLQAGQLFCRGQINVIPVEQE